VVEGVEDLGAVEGEDGEGFADFDEDVFEVHVLPLGLRPGEVLLVAVVPACVFQPLFANDL
jgi:hypothetical protein